MTTDLFADGIDGVHFLRKRERTRLWYRAMPPVDEVPEHLRAAIEHAQLTVIAPDLVEAVRVHPIDLPVADGTDTLVAEWLASQAAGATDLLVAEETASPAERQERIRRRLGSQHNIVPAPQVAPASEPVGEALTDWRDVPANAPTLLLSATDLLDGRQPGPILSPGKRYRVTSADHGVVGLQVMDADGATAVGYCNAVDLACIAPMLVNLAGNGWKTTTRQRLRRVSQGLSTVTGSLIGTV